MIKSVAKVVVHYADMRERGVEFQAAPVQMHFGWWAMFADPDGTRYAFGQWPVG